MSDIVTGPRIPQVRIVKMSAPPSETSQLPPQETEHSTESKPTFTIHPARTAQDLYSITSLFEAYSSWLAIDLSFQDYATEISSLPGKYAPPKGELLLARLVDLTTEAASADLDGLTQSEASSGAPSASSPKSQSPSTPQAPRSPFHDLAVGCIALRPLILPLHLTSGSIPCNAHPCELKRLYTLPMARGLGIGRALLLSIIAVAKAQGYTSMWLDTLLPRMAGAVKLYESVGFRKAERYYQTELEGTEFMKLDLMENVRLAEGARANGRAAVDGTKVLRGVLSDRVLLLSS